MTIGHRQVRPWLVAAGGTVLGVAVAGAVLFTTALAVHDTPFPFELDGNVTNNGGNSLDDWQNVFGLDGVVPPATGTPVTSGAEVFIHDLPSGNAKETQYDAGKDTLDIGAWSHSGGPHVLGLVRDVTEQVKAYELLEQRVVERTREMSMLLDVSNNMTSTLEIEKLLSLILDQLKYVADYDDAAIVVKEESRILILNAKLTPVPDLVQTGSESPFQNLGIIWDKLASGEAVVIGDVCGRSEMAMAFQKAAGESLQTTFHYIRSWLGVPLKQKEHPQVGPVCRVCEPDTYRAGLLWTATRETYQGDRKPGRYRYRKRQLICKGVCNRTGDGGAGSDCCAGGVRWVA